MLEPLESRPTPATMPGIFRIDSVPLRDCKAVGRFSNPTMKTRIFVELPKSVISWLVLLILATLPARAELISLSASGIITLDTSPDTTIPVGTPWNFEIIYDTSAPDRDFELTGTADPTFGKYNNHGAIPALTFFHYRAGTYEVTVGNPSEFGPFSEIDISFGGTHAIDINLNSPGQFPPLAGQPVSFHADFGDFSPSIFTSDALPTDTSLSLLSFDDASVTLITGGTAISGSLGGMTSFEIAAVPEPSACAFASICLSSLLLFRRRRF